MGESLVSASIPARLYPLRSHEVQRRVRTEPFRFKVIPAGRRSGKTELAKRKIVTACLKAYTPRWSDPRFFAAAPTRDQAKKIYWADLKAMFPRVCIRSISESNLIIYLLNGAEAHVVGMDKPERIEGVPWDGGVLDEFANMKERAWTENVRPALADRKGWCWLIGVPEGRNHYYDLYKYAISGDDPDWMGYTWPSIDIVDPAEVEAARRQMDELTFQQEFEASFINFSGRAYYPFLDAIHCHKGLASLYDPKAPLGFCFDFNVAPGVAVVTQELKLPGQFVRDPKTKAPLLDKPLVGTAVIGEVYIPQNSNTEAVCSRLIKDWGSHKGYVECFGDATGGAEGSAKLAGNDWEIIEREMRKAFPSRVYMQVPKANPRERLRVNAMNTRLINGAKEVHMLVDPARAPWTVKDLEGVRLLEGGSGELDKKADPKLTHLTDALGYYIEQRFPIYERIPTVETLRI
jgi:hypothetical protein